ALDMQRDVDAFNSIRSVPDVMTIVPGPPVTSSEKSLFDEIEVVSRGGEDACRSLHRGLVAEEQALLDYLRGIDINNSIRRVLERLPRGLLQQLQSDIQTDRLNASVRDQVSYFFGCSSSDVSYVCLLSR